MGLPDSFLSYKHLKAKIKGIFKGYTVIMVTFCVTKMTIAILPMIM